jgi:hypothetical protein
MAFEAARYNHSRAAHLGGVRSAADDRPRHDGAQPVQAVANAPALAGSGLPGSL